MPRIRFNSGPLSGEELGFGPPGVNIGRRPTCEVVIPDSKVSSEHVLIKKEQDAWWLYDLNSSNGTFVGDEQVDAMQLEL